ncbi:MAG: hypothetical protein ACRDMV_09050 [Streptosporangiales bacterium]
MIVTADILLYAVDSSSPFHAASREWLEGALNGPARVGLPWASLTAFLRISTHPRASADPLEPQEARAFIEDWLDGDPAWAPAPTQRHGEILRRLVIDGDLRGFHELDWFNPVVA